MVSSLHEYTDSEEEEEPIASSIPPAARHAPLDSDSGSREASGSASVSAERSPKVPNSTGTRVKLTLRPSINHLINSHNESHPHSHSQPHSERSSLSPPPPITLKLGMRPSSTTSASIADKATYSSSEEEEDDDRALSDLEHHHHHRHHHSPHHSPNERPAKKARKSTATSPSHKKKKLHPPPQLHAPQQLQGLGLGQSQGQGQGDTVLPALHRKSYDWLQPSTAGASHHGPPERSRITGWTPAEEEYHVKEEATEVVETKPKKSGHKKKTPVTTATTAAAAISDLAGDGKRGKAWRKGLKKGAPIPFKEGGAFVDSGSGHVTPGDATPLEGSPEPGSNLGTSEPPQPAVPRAPSPPFVAADAEKLGFPVFAKPIVAPKINLGPFPKVTQYFQPNNGGDVGRFPRKERVRTFKFTEKQINGIGGGTLKFKSWARGPPSELGRLIQADKEAKELTRQKPKAAPSTAAPATAESPLPPSWENQRPPLLSNISSDSTPTASVLDQAIPLDEMENVSEIGDGDESVISTRESVVAHAAPVTPARARGGKSKAKPRKSKLAQEIHPVSESTSAIEDVL